MGASAPSKEWYFAEGCTRAGFEQWITIENPAYAANPVVLTYMLEGEGTREQSITAPARSRTTVSVNDFLGPGHDVSTLVESERPVVVERPMYFLLQRQMERGPQRGGRQPARPQLVFRRGNHQGQRQRRLL